MRLAVPRFGAQTPGGDGLKKKNTLKLLVQIVVIIILIGGAYYLVHNHYSKNNGSERTTRTVNQFEADLSKSNNNLLKSGDYTSYQATQAAIATQYYYEKDIPDAEKVVANVLASVPKDKVDYQTYLSIVKIDQAKNDQAKLKSDLTILIQKLRAAGLTANADQEQKYLDSLK